MVPVFQVPEVSRNVRKWPEMAGYGIVLAGIGRVWPVLSRVDAHLPLVAKSLNP